MIEPNTRNSQPIWAPGRNGPDTPNTARVRDYWLGGTHHTAVDRHLADQFTLCAPHLPHLVRTHRAFLRRVVTHLVRTGVRQFLDLGSGMPTCGQVHEVADRAEPGCRVVYTDLDPVVADESRQLLAGWKDTAYLCADLREPEQVLDAARPLLDLTQPVAVLAIDVLHFVSDSADPARLLAGYANGLGPRTHIAVSHTCPDERMDDALRLFSDIYAQPLPSFHFRPVGDAARLLDGFEILEPGVVPTPLWRPDQVDVPDRNPEHFHGWAVLSRHK
ncbi:hypothetical protein Lesp02_23110 [Lentzea sp. NBRC 105346]|uniref:SAM-dependent methyltransferase n=1 Tax=Lentzea sp. NBRC 105346 TaxID=3032205 RepID=UPI0024A5BE5D|nr:SAM-dependent methyltransferase [Lentzea sp. NBRC 105346]GLZ30121.1 hypothetical protein Lesp02_23110 [Lentzea sp. NBRC 105346]